MPPGRTVGLNPSDIVLDGDPAHPSPKRGQSSLPIFAHVYCAKQLDGSRCYLVWSDTGLEGSQLPSPKGSRAPEFRPMSVVAKQLHESR